MLRELFTIPVAYADVNTLIRKVNKIIINPFIILLFTIALMYFLWGVVEFIGAKRGGKGDEAIENGKQHMIWGIIGIFIMIAAFAIMQILINSLGVEGIDVRQGTVNLPPANSINASIGN